MIDKFLMPIRFMGVNIFVCIFGADTDFTY